jgi:enoyl-[acyl-carrier protein] reductase II
MVLVPAVARSVSIPVIAAGGIATGRQLLAAMILGAEGGQLGSRFVASEEASSHPGFKARVIAAGEGETVLTLKQLTPVRVIRNEFYGLVKSAEEKGVGVEQLKELLGKGRAKKGMFEGELDEGELEIGQVSSLLDSILPAATIVKNVWKEFEEGLLNPIGKY